MNFKIKWKEHLEWQLDSNIAEQGLQYEHKKRVMSTKNKMEKT
jgi:hypothetical protein